MTLEPTAPGSGAHSDRPTRVSAALCSAALSVLFLVVYGACNEISARRADVGVLYWEWERLIPFVPSAIVPYMSIDLFFVASPFLCATRNEMRGHAERIMTAILAAGAVFLLFPLSLAFDPPDVGGVYGRWFRLLEGFDRPYNLFPSLHITLGLILLNFYVRHSRGILRVAVWIWFLLVLASTVLTWRHHVPDVLGGAVLAVICFYVVPFVQPVAAGASVGAASMNLRAGMIYAAASVAMGAVAVGMGGGGLLLLWPAVSLAIVSAAYFGWGAVVFRKAGGRLPLSAKLVLAPYLIGLRLAHAVLSRGRPRWVEIRPNLTIGRRLSDREAEELAADGFGAVLDLTAEYDTVEPFRKMAYRNIPVLDLTVPTTTQLASAAEFITSRIREGGVYVHCALGVSRSAMAAGAYLLAGGHAGSVEEAVATVRKARPETVLTSEAFAALEGFRHVAEVPGVTNRGGSD